MTLEDLALLFTRGIGSRGAASLIEHFGSAEAIFAASRGELIEGAGLRADIAERILSGEGMKSARHEVEYCRKHNIRAIAATDAEYPAPLRETIDRPHILFVRGNVDALSQRTLSVVGTREASPAGIHSCDMLIAGLAAAVDELCIVSGLAYGIDAAAHRSALAHGVSTVAVVACSHPEITPAPHRTLAEDIIAHGGAIVTELHSATHQNGALFIARNRIIAGLGHGTLVVESPASGGALATADMADGYGRVVMATPGRITDPTSFGTNNLIRSGKARLVLTASDIIDDIGWQAKSNTIASTDNDRDELLAGLSSAERMIYLAFDKASTLDWPQLIDATGLSMGELAMVVMDLELKGLIRALPGKRYERV